MRIHLVTVKKFILWLMIPVTLLNSGCNNFKYSADSILFKEQHTELSKQAKKYFNLANTTKDPIEKNKLLLLSAELLININEAEAAQNNLNLLNTNHLNTNQYATWKILLAQISLLKKDVANAKNLIAHLGFYPKLDHDVYKKLYNTKVNIFQQNGEILEAIQEQILLEKFLSTKEELADNYKNIWGKLQQLSPSFLKSANQNNYNYTMQGWLNIAYIIKQYDTEPAELSEAIEEWKKNYPKHPATSILDLKIIYQNNATKTNDNPALPFNNIHKIALLLPLSGPYKKSGIAIKNGFLVASYHRKSNYKPSIIIMDTHQQSITNLYKKSIQEKANLIVGPLLKEDIEHLIKLNKLTIPVIALNTIEHLHDNLLYQIGLSPELEGKLIVEKARENSHKNALLIIENNELYKRIGKTIVNNWQLMGKNILDTLKFNNQINLDKNLKIMLGIEDSNNRAHKLANLGIKFNFDPTRRQDIDCIFLITNAVNSRQIKPLLNFYYANKIPVYANSNIYTGISNPSLDRDLDGIQFCDMPWMLDPSIYNTNIHQSIKSLWKESFAAFPRLYGLGIDAYKLSNKIPILLSMPEIGISGVTGMLKMHDNIITRQLMWGTFENGSPVVVNQKN